MVQAILSATLACLAVVAAVPHSQVHFNAQERTSTLKGPESKLLSNATFAYIDGLMDRWDLTGLSMSVVKGPEDGGGAWTREAFGFGTRDRHGNAMEKDTLMAIASNSKLFVATSVGLLIHNESATYTSLIGSEKGSQKRLTWETKVADVVPEFKLMSEDATNHVNLIDLLGHRTGMPRHDLSYNETQTASEIVASWRHLEPSAEIREHWQYNNIAFVTASLLPAILTGVDFPTYVRDNIFRPLGMKDAHLINSEAKATGRRADGFAKTGLNWTMCAREFEQTGELVPSRECLGKAESIGWWQEGDGLGTAGAGGVTATAEDLSIWLQTLLTKGVSPLSGDQVIPAAIIEDLAKARAIVSNEPAWPELGIVTYGLAQERYTYRGHDVIEHGGSVPGHMSQVIRLPNSNIGISTVVNDNELGTLAANFAIKWRVLDDLLGLEPIDWETRMYNKTIQGVIAAEKARVIPPAAVIEPTGGFDAVQGLYTHAAYGHLHLCLEPRSAPDVDVTGSEFCDDLLASQPFAASKGGPAQYLARPNKIWEKYFLLTHFSGNDFNVSAAVVWPETNATSLFLDTPIIAKLGEGGLGFAGNFWGAGAEVKTSFMEGGVSEAEVFFMKQQDSKSTQ